MEKKRMDWLDAAKGLGILDVVMVGHALRPEMQETYLAARLIYDSCATFMLGLFMVVPGITYRLSGGGRAADPKRFLPRKAQALLIPFFGYALFIYAVFSFAIWFPLTAKAFQGTEYTGMPLTRYLWLTVSGDNPYAVHLWYVWTLFWIMMAAYAIDLLCQRWKLPRRKVMWCAALVFYAVGCAWNSDNVVRRVLVHMVYFVYGFEFAEHPDLVRHKSVYSLALVALSVGVTVWYVSSDWRAATWYGEVLWQACWLAVRLVIIWGVFHLSTYLKDVKWLAYLGRESFWIYLLHQPFCCGFVGLVLYVKLGLPMPVVYVSTVSLSLLLPLCALQVGRRAARRLRKQPAVRN